MKFKDNIDSIYNMHKYHIFKHLHTINKHRFYVFIYCTKCGFLWRGLVHDLSKYNPKEFFPSARNYLGDKSPITNERKEFDGYSQTFVHHTRKNRHHFEYWVDLSLGDIRITPMPFPFAVEYCCDIISASKVYSKKSFDRNMPLAFFNKIKDKIFMHSATKEFVEIFLTKYKESGFSDIKKKSTKIMYKTICSKYPKTEIILVNNIGRQQNDTRI